MSDLSNAVEKVAETLGKKSRKSNLEWFTAIAPFFIAAASLVTTIILANLDSKEKENASKTSQMDAVSKVLTYLSDTSTRKNTMGLITLSNYGQDELATKFMKSGLFQKETLEKAGMYIATNSKDTTIQNKAKAYFEPRQIALQNAIDELNSGAKSSVIGKNVGEFVRKYNSFSGVSEDQPWAGTFVSWCYNKDIKYFKPSGSISALENYFKSQHATFTFTDELPEPGDIYFYDWNGSRAIGIVEKYSNTDSVLHAIEGDSNEVDNGPNYKVARVSFSKKDLLKKNCLFARVKQE